VPSSYQQETEVSEQAESFGGGAAAHPAGKSGTHRGAVMTHAPSWQSAVVRQPGRGSSPQLQCAFGCPMNCPAATVQGGVHGLPPGGAELGHPVPPPLPPVAGAPAVPPLDPPPLDAPPFAAPPEPSEP
jgi:hypothetical protein